MGNENTGPWCDGLMGTYDGRLWFPPFLNLTQGTEIFKDALNLDSVLSGHLIADLSINSYTHGC